MMSRQVTSKPSNQVLSTRIIPPNEEGALISRLRLEKIPHQGIQPKLIMIKAPAGYGKSVLLRQWYHGLADGGVLSVWLSVDNSVDNMVDDVQVFFRYLVYALREKLPTFGEQLLTLLEREDANSLCIEFINEIAACEQTVCLFVDDFNELKGTRVESLFNLLLRDSPQNFHVAIATREMPAISLSRLRMLGGVLTLSASDLAFTHKEIREYIKAFGRSKINLETSAVLHEKTEGWIAAERLLLANYSGGDISGRHRDISDFFQDDVIAGIEPDLRVFLLRTSVLRRLNPEVCNFLLESEDAKTKLSTLDDNSLFIIAEDKERYWFRYHPLFADFLLSRLQETDPKLEKRMHMRACVWYEMQNQTEDAIHHAMQGGDKVKAAELFDASCNQIFYTGLIDLLMERTDQIPDNILTKYPNILLGHVWALIIEWDFEEAKKELNQISDQLTQMSKDPDIDSEELHKLQQILLHREMMLAQFCDDMPLVEDLCNRMENDFPSDDAYLLGTLHTSLIYAQREQFKFQAIEKHDTKAREFYRKSGSQFVFVWHESIVGPTQFIQGASYEAEATLRKAIATAERLAGAGSTLVGIPSLLLTSVLYERNQLEDVQEILSQYLPIVENYGFVDQLIAGYVCAARIAMLAGNVTESQRLLKEGEQHAIEKGFKRLHAHLVSERIRIALHSEKMPIVQSIAKEENLYRSPSEVHPSGQFTTIDEIDAISWIRVALAEARTNDAVPVIKRWQKFSEKQGAVLSAVKFSILLSSAMEISGDRLSAQRSMRHALGLAVGRGFFRCFLDEGLRIQVALESCCQQDGFSNDKVNDFAIELYELFKIEHGLVVAPVSASEEGAAPAEALAARELEILKFVAAGLRNREIGETLGLTEGSVKWYLQQIFQKLGIRRRSQAVQRAKQLGYLQ